MSFAEPGVNANPFTSNLADGLRVYEDVSFLSAANMLWRPFDILHVHWPENLFRADGTLKTAVKTLLGLTLMMRAKLGRKPIVYTKHNTVPHETPGRLYSRLYKWVERSARIDIYLNESSENDVTQGVTILHGDYPQRSFNPPVTKSDEFVMLFYGQLRRYKGVEDLLAAFEKYHGERVRLVIRGSVPDNEYDLELSARAAADPRIDYKPGFIQDADLEAMLAAADLVALPYKNIYNSGAALLALSRQRPILVPDGPAMRSLQDEVGDSFVRIFHGQLDAEDVATARELPVGSLHHKPDLSRRQWAQICELHALLYDLVRDRRSFSRGEIRHLVSQDPRFVAHSARNDSVTGAKNG